MTTATIKANLLQMDRGNHFIFNGKNVWAPLADCRARDIEETLDAVGDGVVIAQFRTFSDDKRRARDIKTYMRRLRLSDKYTVGTASQQVCGGYVMDTIYVVTITRN